MKESKWQIVKELAILGSIVYFLKMSVLGAFLVPTGSMENTILPGDFLFGNQIIYGMRTPDWFGIPWTDVGVDLPSYRCRLQGFCDDFNNSRTMAVTNPAIKFPIHNRKIISMYG